VAALQAILVLLASIPADRLPTADIMDSALSALTTWANSCGCFTDSPLFPEWSQRLMASLYLLLEVSGCQKEATLAAYKITQVSQ
jgi:hypothetical protein